eukprot:CAMPEP_0178897526 /NCGR_PEP_ID=MMETSP0786-20121207/1801_1 /TAXON_ID=186022 /ORGANISM="Thalassionema frauenfeldii, Strain CCMP 1798" /LENGTH=32 /DNA_ID= /DNA_START= /DNA_END= /DNA_ORIENTATION=
MTFASFRGICHTNTKKSGDVPEISVAIDPMFL